MAKYLTRESLEKFKKELDYLEKVERRKIAEKLKYASSFGDLTENAAYDEAKDAQGFLEARILELKQIIAEAKVINKKNNGRIQVGSFVWLTSGNKEQNAQYTGRRTTRYKKEKFQIVEPEEADPVAGKISYKSPLGEILLGKKEGAALKLITPGEKKIYKIAKID